LNGHYLAFYPDKNLKEDGYFKTGLKDGVWKTWNRKGDLTGVTTWDEGVEAPNDQSIWKKIPFINRKDTQTPPAKVSGN
jgi:antitoxin component YwqK of YwqJK toxin-antitoxin module